MDNLRRRAIAAQLTDLLVERQRRGFEDQTARSAGSIKIAQAAREAGRISFEQYVASVGSMAAHINEGRWLDHEYDTELAPFIAIMKEAEARAGLREDQSFPLGEGPEEFQAASAAYEEVLDGHFASILLEFDLHDVLAIWRNDRTAYDRLLEVGRTKDREAVDGGAAIAALIPLYEADADRSETSSAFYATCAMLGAAAEARLLQRALSRTAEAEAARQILEKSLRPKGADPTKWTFEQLIAVAERARWIGTIEDEDDIATYEFVVSSLVNQLRAMRNYLHPWRHRIEKPLEVLTIQEVELARAAYGSLVVSLELSALDQNPPSQP